MSNKKADKKKNDLYKQVQNRLVASLLYDSTDANRALELVHPEDFAEPTLEIIYSSILEISRKDEVVSAISIAEHLEDAGNLELVGGPANLYHLRDLGSKYILEAPVEVYARLVKEASAKHKVTDLLIESQKNFKNDSGVKAIEGVSELQSALNNEIFKLSDESTHSILAEDYDDYLALIEERKKITEENSDKSAGLQGIPSLLPSLNYYTTGWLPGQLITVGSRTGVGKSVFAVNSAVAAAQSGKSVLFFSLEMTDIELKDRIIASVTGIPMNKLSRGTITDEDREVLAEMDESIRSMKIKIETDPKVTIDTIRARALRQAQSNDGLDFIIIDYLQLITPVGKFSSRQEAVADISRNAKLLAKQLNVPVMVLVQVNRENKDDENSLPRMSNIRESGAVAQDSNIVILLHRDEAMDDSIPHTLVLLEKNRNGEAQKTIRCHSNLECSVFREVTKERDVERMTDDEADELIDDLDLDDFLDDMDDLEELF